MYDHKRYSKNILFLNHTSELGGGAEEVLIALLKNIDKNRFNPIVALPKSGPLETKLKEIGITIEYVQFIGLTRTKNLFKLLLYLIRFIYTSISLINIIKKSNISLIYANTYYSAILGIIAVKTTRRPFMWHVHDIHAPDKITKLTIPLICTSAHKVIAISHAVKNNLKEYNIESEKIEIVYNGVELKYFKCNKNRTYLEENLPIYPDDIVICNVGQFSHRKNQKDILFAAEKIVKTYPNTKYLLIGKAISDKGRRYEKEIKKLTKDLGLDENVIFTGYRSDIPELLSGADIFVLTSLQEPFGLAVIEAMASCLPVIATKVGAVPEIIENDKSGFVIRPRDVDDLTKKIILLIENPEKRFEMGRIGRQIVEKKFDINKNIAKIEKIYKRLSGDVYE